MCLLLHNVTSTVSPLAIYECFPWRWLIAGRNMSPTTLQIAQPCGVMQSLSSLAISLCLTTISGDVSSLRLLQLWHSQQQLCQLPNLSFPPLIARCTDTTTICQFVNTPVHRTLRGSICICFAHTAGSYIISDTALIAVTFFAKDVQMVLFWQMGYIHNAL